MNEIPQITTPIGPWSFMPAQTTGKGCTVPIKKTKKKYCVSGHRMYKSAPGLCGAPIDGRPVMIVGFGNTPEDALEDAIRMAKVVSS